MSEIIASDAEHRLFSASGSPRWIPCPGSLLLEQGKEDRGNIYAATGTTAHLIIERALKGELLDPYSLVGTTHVVEEPGQDRFEVEITTDLVDGAMVAITWAEQLRPKATLLLSESKVDYSDVIGARPGDGGGTCDITILLGKTAYIADYKNGRNFVPADTSQNKLYGVGRLQQLAEMGIYPHKVVLVVIQPNGPGDAIREYETTRAELLSWAQLSVAPAVERAYTILDRGTVESSDLAPSDKACQWCKAKATCPALRDYVKAARVAPLNDSEAIAQAMRDAPLIEGWLVAVRERAYELALGGARIPGWKLVLGDQGPRKWDDSGHAVVEALPKKIAYKAPAPISPTDVEKLVKAGKVKASVWEALQGHVTRSEAKPVLVEASSPKAEWRPESEAAAAQEAMLDALPDLDVPPGTLPDPEADLPWPATNAVEEAPTEDLW